MEKIFPCSVVLALSLFSCKTTLPIQKAQWLIGTWENHTSRGAVYETWTRESKQTLVAKSYLINQGDTTFLETMRLMQVGDSLYYIPTVTDQNEGKPITFALREIDDSTMTFENATHYFPQVISYQKVGQDSLLAIISGTRDGKEAKRFFPMRKKP